MSLAENIKLLRKTLGLTQTEFAGRVNKTMRTVQVWESGTGEPNRNNINDIVNAFNVNVEWLRSGEGEIFRSHPAAEYTGLPLNTRLLTDIIISVENMLKQRHKVISPLDKATLIVDIYKTCIITNNMQAVTEDKVGRALSLLYIP